MFMFIFSPPKDFLVCREKLAGRDISKNTSGKILPTWNRTYGATAMRILRLSIHISVSLDAPIC